MRKITPIELSAPDRAHLEKFIGSGSAQARLIKHANVLLKLAVGWTPQQIAEAFELDPRTVFRLKARFLKEGLAAILKDKPRSGAPKRINGNHKAVIIATTCTTPPAGHSRWTLRLLADKMVELAVVETISHTTIADILKKTNSSPGNTTPGASPS